MTRCTLFASDIGDVPANLAFTNNFNATTNPGVNNDSTQNYQPGSTWINKSTKTVFECIDATPGAAVWTEFAAAGGNIPDASAGYAAANNAATFTATAAQIAGGSAFNTLDLTGNPAGAANVQLPTVANLVASLNTPQAGDSFVLRIKNSANSGTWTVTTNTGWTINGTATIATGTWREFIVTLTSLTAATIQNVGGGATL